MSTRKRPYPPPGTPVFVRLFGVISHFGIVSDRWRDGSPMVISHSWRQGTTAEEPWAQFAQGSAVRVAQGLTSDLEPWRVLSRARSWIGRPYRLLTQNCEHHVRFALGLKVRSPQVRFALTTSTVLGAVWLLSDGDGGV